MIKLLLNSKSQDFHSKNLSKNLKNNIDLKWIKKNIVRNNKKNYINIFLNYNFIYRNPQGEELLIDTVIKFLSEKHDLIVIDGGYNKGKWSEYVLNKITPKQIIGYELLDTTYNFFKKNESDKLTILHKGLYNQNKIINLSSTNCGCNSYNVEDNISSSNKGDINTVELVTLDSELKEKNNCLFFIKIDIEGSEYKAIEGMVELLKNNKIVGVQWEMNKRHSNISNSLKDFINLFKKFNFNTFILGKDHLLRIDSEFYNKFYDFKSTKSIWNLNTIETIAGPKCMNLVSFPESIYYEIKSKKIINFLD